MNTIIVKITHKETGIGIPDLLVIVYDIDPKTRPEVLLPDGTVPAQNEFSPHQASLLSFGDSLGSRATDRNGIANLTYADEEFKIRNPEEKRPDLFLLVAAPEEIGQNPNERILFSSRGVRQNAGRTETYLIRLTTEQLTSAGIPLPTLEPEDTVSSNSILTRLNTVETKRLELTTGIAEISQKRVEKVRDQQAVYEENVKPKLLKALSRLQEEDAAFMRVVSPGESVFEKSNEAVQHGIDQVAKFAPTVTSLLNLTDAQVIELKRLVNPEDGLIDAQELRRVVSNGQGTNAFLVRENPLLQLCRKPTAPEVECADVLAELLDEQPQPHEESTPATPTTPASDEPTIGDDDVPRYLGRLMETMTSPEDQVVNGLTPRATSQVVQEQVKQFSLEKSPADTPAYHDFHNLQIAFEYVWQEAIDQGILDLAEGAYNAIVEMAGNSNPAASLEAEEPDPFRVLMNEAKVVLKAQFDGSVFNTPNNYVITNWGSGNGSKSGTVMGDKGAGAVGPAGTWANEADPYPEPRPEHPLAHILNELEKRLKEPYNFTVYAANSKERSVNFGLLLTYRQKWSPEAYQAGELVKTLTLAPKQVQKISVTRKTHKKRYQKEVENRLRSWREETSQTSRAEQEIIRRASVKTNFTLTADQSVKAEIPGLGGADAKLSTTAGRDASKTSDDVKKSFHEAVFKASQEYKNEVTTEVSTEETTDFETVESTEITNPNDEIAVTFLFYELQRRYRVTEAIHKLTPVILVAQEMPRPDEIDADWILTYDWILRRVILDDSFLPAFDYLMDNVAGDEIALSEMRVNIQQQRTIVAQLNQQLVVARQRAADLSAVLSQGIWLKVADTQNTTPKKDGRGPLDFITDAVEHLPLIHAAEKVGEKIFGGAAPATDKAQLAYDAAKESAARAADDARDLMYRLEQEVTALNSLLEKYAKAYSEYINRLTQIARLRVHVMQNALYYMQAIWHHEPPDQRFFRLHNTKVPRLNSVTKKLEINFDEKQDDSLANQAHMATTRFSPSPVHTYKAKVKECKIEKPPSPDPQGATSNPQNADAFAKLSELADLDTLLGFKGNYAIFPLKESNALTDFMMEPYVDLGFNNLIDPDGPGNWSLEEFAAYVCCLKEKLSDTDFNSIKDQLREQYKQLLSAARRGDDILTIPSGSLFIEALPAEHSLIEEFKARHRAVDVKKVQAETRRMELENIRYAARILNDQFEDPEIESVKRVFINGDADPSIAVDGDN